MAREKESEWPSWKIFLTSFGISLVILLTAAAAVIGTIFYHPGEQYAGAESDPETAEAVLPYHPDAKMGLNLLVISVEERSDAPHAFTLFRFDPANERILLIPIPTETVATVKAKTETFAAHYDYAGSLNAKLAAESLFLCTVHRYVRLNRQAAVRLTDELGGVSVRFEEAYRTDRVDVPAGTHRLSGELLYEIANSPPENAVPDSWRLSLAGELLARKLNSEADEKLDSLMNLFWNAVDTDLSRFDYTTRRKALTYFLKNPEKRIEIVPLSGSWNRTRTEFVPGEAILTELRGMVDPK